jgi:hypothetical protein
MPKVCFGLTKLACNGGSWFWTDSNGLECLSTPTVSAQSHFCLTKFVNIITANTNFVNRDPNFAPAGYILVNMVNYDSNFLPPGNLPEWL